MPGTTEPEVVHDAEGSEPLSRPRAGRTPAACCVAALVVTLLALVVAGFLPWQADVSGWAELAGAQADLRTAGEMVAVVLLAPTVLLWLFALTRPTSLPRRIALVCTAVGTAFLLFTAAIPPDGQSAPGIGMGLAVFAYPAALCAGVALDVLATRLRPGRPRAFVAVAVVIVLALGLGFGAQWFAGRRVLDATTTTGEPAVDARDTPPGSVLWQQPLAADGTSGEPQVAILTGGLVALRADPGRVVVRDPATGAERWHYARADSASGGLVATEDGRTLLADFTVRDRDYVVALDSATGTVRWQRWQQAGTTTFLLPTAVLTTVPDGVAAFGHQATAYDPGTGSKLWSADLGQWCHQASALAGAAGAALVLTPCHTDAVAAHSDLGIRATGSHRRVLWQATLAQGVPVEPSSIVLANQDAVAVHGPTGADVFAPATGRQILHTADEQPLAAGGGRLVLAAAGRIVVRDGNTGSLTQPQPATALVPQGGSARAADIRDGSAYVLVARQDNRPMRLVDIDLTSGATVGAWPLPAAFSTRYATWPVSVQASDGEVIVSGLAMGVSGSVAVRVP